MVKAKSTPVKKIVSAPVQQSKVVKKTDGNKGFAAKSMRKMIKDLVKECGGGGRTVGKQGCDILQIVLEKHCTAILKGAQVRALSAKRSTVTGDDVKKEANAVHAEMWPERFKK